MSSFLTNLAKRAAGTNPDVRPRLPSLFEPVPTAEAFNFGPMKSNTEESESKPSAEGLISEFRPTDHRLKDPTARFVAVESLSERREEGNQSDPALSPQSLSTKTIPEKSPTNTTDTVRLSNEHARSIQHASEHGTQLDGSLRHSVHTAPGTNRVESSILPPNDFASRGSALDKLLGPLPRETPAEARNIQYSSEQDTQLGGSLQHSVHTAPGTSRVESSILQPNDFASRGSALDKLLGPLPREAPAENGPRSERTEALTTEASPTAVRSVPKTATDGAPPINHSSLPSADESRSKSTPIPLKSINGASPLSRETAVAEPLIIDQKTSFRNVRMDSHRESAKDKRGTEDPSAKPQKRTIQTSPVPIASLADPALQPTMSQRAKVTSTTSGAATQPSLLSAPGPVQPKTIHSTRSLPDHERRSNLAPTAVSAPEVHITIGRLEIRALPPVATPQKKHVASVVGLDEYLRQRTAGGAR